MITKLGNMDSIFGYLIDDSVFIIHSTVPIAGKGVFDV
jgi:hypothetical protein